MTTVENALKIDAAGLDRLSCTAKDDPSAGKKVLKATTVCETGFRNMTYVRDLAPMLVGEPPALLGDDAAPNPSETALAALGSCISVGMLANATHRGVTLTKIEVQMEGDIDISAVWGVGDVPDDKVPGFTDVRCTVTLAGDADDATLREIHDNAIKWSPVVNTFRRPAAVESSLVVGS
ncbi:OsmC family protein [Amycolatopsis alkalitolerans]|uniref:OsmC family protein n=1 Tax=Amycolatopsis alkalitolerans TaxID=2547244 RepID=A0A5C4M4G8_9PSEU|nr:OsmC family protein [Amycolatopsis alkalitolerans]TNC28049.1 OsmC family protein [Amycolatopsis alkalitolerans]